jgi:hypothetical protein
MLQDEMIVVVEASEVDVIVEDPPDITVSPKVTPDVIVLATGSVGSPGPEGPEGDVGPPGPQGVQGPSGPTGPQGEAGSGITMKGSQPTEADLPPTGNDQGDAYLVEEDDSLWIWDGGGWISGGSIQGPPGPIGPQGVQGPTGATGPTGAAGTPGSTGATGATGSTGPAGPGVPVGGALGLSLVKKTAADYDTEWKAISGGGVDYIGDWAAPTVYKKGDVVRHAGVDYLAVNDSTGQVPPLASPLAPGVVCLFDQILAADAATIDIPNISQQYQHLKLELSLRTNQAGGSDHVALRFNNDSAATYYTLVTGYIAASELHSYVSNGATKGMCGMACGAMAEAGMFGPSEISIPDYASSKKKAFHSETGGAYNQVALNAMWSLTYGGFWGPKTEAINRITLSPNGGSLFVAGSRVTLYGTLAAGQPQPITTLAPGGIGTAFPASPTNGETFTLVDSLTVPTYAWDFRYVASITDGYKWVFIGGAPLYTSVLGVQAVAAANVWTHPTAPSGPEWVAARTGEYEVAFSCTTTSGGAAIAAAMGVANASVGVTPVGATVTSSNDNSQYIGLSARTRITLNAGQTMRAVHYVQVAGMQVQQRVLSIVPVRLS